jgi:hypothetical protein
MMTFACHPACYLIDDVRVNGVEYTIHELFSHDSDLHCTCSDNV